MIGVFDSGVGGLSVLREIRRQLPQEDLVYVADSGYAPYGDRSPEFIEARVTAIAGFLLQAGARAVVMACNTATVTAVQALRAWCPVPIVAIEPAIKPAVSLTRSGVVGVLATQRTVASSSVARLCERYGEGRRILLQACPGLVEQVERADLDGPATMALLRRYVLPLLEQGADTLVLGCTHYPFLADAIRTLAGPGVTIVDPAAAVARELCRRLGEEPAWGGEQMQGGERAQRAASAAVGGERFHSSGPVELAAPVISALWGRPVPVHALPAAASGPRPEPDCPVCGEPNGCAPAGCGSFEVDCWCSRVKIDAAALARVPAQQRGLACLCPRCAAVSVPEGAPMQGDALALPQEPEPGQEGVPAARASQAPVPGR